LKINLQKSRLPDIVHFSKKEEKEIYVMHFHWGDLIFLKGSMAKNITNKKMILGGVP
jgi:hypothetical protein